MLIAAKTDRDESYRQMILNHYLARLSSTKFYIILALSTDYTLIFKRAMDTIQIHNIK